MNGMSGGEKEKSNDALLIFLELFVYYRKCSHSIEINHWNLRHFKQKFLLQLVFSKIIFAFQNISTFQNIDASSLWSVWTWKTLIVKIVIGCKVSNNYVFKQLLNFMLLLLNPWETNKKYLKILP